MILARRNVPISKKRFTEKQIAFSLWQALNLGAIGYDAVSSIVKRNTEGG